MNTQRLDRPTPPVPPSEDDEDWPHLAPGEPIPEAQAGDPSPRLDEEMPAQLG